MKTDRRIQRATLALLTCCMLAACGESNAPPTITAGSLAINEDQAGVADVSASDPDGDAITMSILTVPAKGQASLSTTAPYRLTYTPNPDVNGADAVTVRVSDDHGNTADVQISISISPVADPVQMASQVFVADEDAALTARVTASDPDGDALTFSVVTPPGHGVLQIAGTPAGTFQYTPAANYNGPDSFVVSCSDGSTTPVTASMNLTVRAVNDPPVASDDAFVVPASGATAVNVLNNDSDIDGDALTIEVTQQPAGASASVTNGQITITPSSGVAGPTRMTYRVTDAAGATATATVSLVIGSARPVFYTSGDTADTLHIYRFDMFSNQMIDTPVPAGETLYGFATSANARRMIYITRGPGTPGRHRIWLRDLTNLNAPVEEIPTGSTFTAGNLIISPDGNHALVNNEYIYLNNLTARQVFDSSAEQTLITRNSSYAYYSRLIGGGSRAIYRVPLFAGGVGGPQQMSATPGSAQGLGLMLGLSPDETLIASQGLYIDPMASLQVHAYVTPANGTQLDRRISPAYSQPADFAGLPTLTFDNQYAFYAGTVSGVIGIYALDLSQAGAAQPIATAPSGWYVGGAALASDSRTIFYAMTQLNSLAPGTMYKGRLDQPGGGVPYSLGAGALKGLYMAPDGGALVVLAGTDWLVARGPDFNSASLLYGAPGSMGTLSYAPDSHAAALRGTDTQPGLRIVNPLIPSWSVQLPLGNFGQCVAWAGQRC